MESKPSKPDPDDFPLQIRRAPGTCCPDIELGTDAICKGCGTDHKLDAVIAELALRRDWADDEHRNEEKEAAEWAADSMIHRHHEAKSIAFRKVRDSIKARIRYLQRRDKNRQETWLALQPMSPGYQDHLLKQQKEGRNGGRGYLDYGK